MRILYTRHRDGEIWNLRGVVYLLKFSRAYTLSFEMTLSLQKSRLRKPSMVIYVDVPGTDPSLTPLRASALKELVESLLLMADLVVAWKMPS